MTKKFIGGDQNPLRQGFLRAAVMARIVGPKSVTHFIQDGDAIGGRLNRNEWRLGPARDTYFPFSFDCFSHLEFPGDIKGTDEQTLAYIRNLFGHPRLIVNGPDEALTQEGVHSDNQPLWSVILEGFELEINWIAGLVNSKETRQRADELWQLINGHKGSLTELLIKLGKKLLPILQEIEITALTAIYRNTAKHLPDNDYWLIRDSHRWQYQGEPLTKGAVLVPRGRVLIADLTDYLGFRFFATHLAYEQNPYVKIHFQVDLPVDWSRLIRKTTGDGWKEWAKRPTLLALYVMGGEDLIEKVVKNAQVEGL